MTIAVDFVASLRQSKGQWAGQPLDVLPWQADVLTSIFGTIKADGSRQYRTAYVEVPRKNGKALAIDTPVLTSRGWRTQGTLEVGDVVFDDHGHPCNVVAVGQVEYQRPCYQLTFSDDSNIVADAEHEWFTIARSRWGGIKGKRHGNPTAEGIRTTEQIRSTLHAHPKADCGQRVEWNHSIPVAGAVLGCDLVLPVAPYTLGAWLGDGTSASAQLTCAYADAEIVANIERDGYRVRLQIGGCTTTTGRWSIGSRNASDRTSSLQTRLRLAGLLKRKHIPQEYFCASVSQRLALLQGLMDTDGDVSKTGQCTFSTSSRQLRDDVHALIRTLGIKATINERRAKIYGRDVGATWRITFQGRADCMPFRLTRKAARISELNLKKTRTSSVKIVGCVSIDSVPVRCIQVDSPSRLYLAGRGCIPTHNSTLAAGIALYALLGDDEGGPEVYLAAVDRDQASIVFDVVREMIRQDEYLTSILRVIPSQRRIQYPGRAGVLRVIAADAAGSHGFNASCVIADEVHAWPSRELWDVLQTSMGARRQPLMIGITTAGFEQNSLGGQLHEYAERVRDGVVDDPAFLPVLYGAQPDEPWDDPAVWRRANPSLGHTITEEYLAAECARAKAVPAYESAFRRLHLCQWVNQEVRYLPMDAWSDCAGGVAPVELESQLEGEVCYGGLDLSATTDMTALVLVFPRGDGTYDVVPRFWLPADDLKRRCDRDRVPYDVWARQGLLSLTPGNVVDYAHVRAEVNALAKRFVIGGISYDRWAATQLVQELVADGIDMAPMSQGMASMAAPTKELLTLALGRRLRHANHPILRWQADNLVVTQDAAGNVRPAKHKARQRIDGMVALIMGIDRASRNAGAAMSVYEERGMLVL